MIPEEFCTSVSVVLLTALSSLFWGLTLGIFLDMILSRKQRSNKGE